MKFILVTLLAIFNLKAEVYEINKDHSKVQFSVEYMSMTKVDGIFKNYVGTFAMNGNQISKIDITIDPNSVDTNEPKRDFHLKGHEFFFASNYPAIKFKSINGLAVTEKKSHKFSGELTIRDFTKTISGDLLYKGKIVDPWGKENLFFEYKTEIDRKDFGMKWNKELDQGGYLVGDKVQVVISIQAQKSGDKTAFSTHMIPSTKGIVERDQLKKGKIKKLSTSTDPNAKKD